MHVFDFSLVHNPQSSSLSYLGLELNQRIEVMIDEDEGDGHCFSIPSAARSKMQENFGEESSSIFGYCEGMMEQEDEEIILVIQKGDVISCFTVNKMRKKNCWCFWWGISDGTVSKRKENNCCALCESVERVLGCSYWLKWFVCSVD